MATEVMTGGATGVLVFDSGGEIDTADLVSNSEGVLISDPQGPRGTTWYTSGHPYTDPTEVPDPIPGDQFLYTNSGDVFIYSGPPNDWGHWNYTGSVKGPPTDWQDSSTQNWSGAVSLAGVAKPQTIRATLTGNVTGVTLPNWSASNSGSITLILIQDATGGRTWVQPGLSMMGIKLVLSTTPAARDMVVMFWSGAFWVCIPSAMNVS